MKQNSPKIHVMNQDRPVRRSWTNYPTDLGGHCFRLDPKLTTEQNVV